jgi:hypothetical protein
MRAAFAEELLARLTRAAARRTRVKRAALSVSVVATLLLATTRRST